MRCRSSTAVSDCSLLSGVFRMYASMPPALSMFLRQVCMYKARNNHSLAPDFVWRACGVCMNAGCSPSLSHVS